MKLFYSERRNYIINKPIDNVYNLFDDMSIEPYKPYPIKGELVEVDLLLFSFRYKGRRYKRHSYDGMATFIYVTLTADGDKTRLLVQTKTNPVYIVLMILSIIIVMIMVTALLLGLQGNRWKMLWWLAPSLVIWLVDKFSKQLLVGFLETELRKNSKR